MQILAALGQLLLCQLKRLTAYQNNDMPNFGHQSRQRADIDIIPKIHYLSSLCCPQFIYTFMHPSLIYLIVNLTVGIKKYMYKCNLLCICSFIIQHLINLDFSSTILSLLYLYPLSTIIYYYYSTNLLLIYGSFLVSFYQFFMI